MIDRIIFLQEFEDKTNFIATYQHFAKWAPRYKKQLAMALEKETVPYDTILCRQGAPVRGIYFIIR